MIVIDLAITRIKQVLRSKEFYFYVIALPLFFLILLGFLSKGWAPTTQTVGIGYYSSDVPIIDSITGESLNMEEEFFKVLVAHENDKGLKTFSISNHTDLEVMDKDIQDLIIQGGIEIPNDFSLQASNVTRFYSVLMITQLLVESFDLYPAEFSGINASLAEIAPYIESSAELVVKFHGDVTLQTAMQAYTSTWQILSEFIVDYTTIHANSIWLELKSTHGLSFDLNITDQSASESSITTEVKLISAGTGDVVEDFQAEFFSRLLPGQIIQMITLSSISAIWVLDHEIRTGLLKRIKLTKLSSIQYFGGVLLAWAVIALLQGIFILVLSAILGFFSFAINPLAWLMMLVTMVILGLIAATLALLIGSFMEGRVATPILVLFGSTIQMFVAEYYIEVQTAFTFAGKNFSVLDFIFLRPAFLIMKNSMGLESAADVTYMLFDLLVLFLWFILIFAIGATLFNKFKLRYAEKE
ncbi:MAG: ABC transporter permease [Candidatus Thorarchaeota archaeon]